MEGSKVPPDLHLLLSADRCLTDPTRDDVFVCPLEMPRMKHDQVGLVLLSCGEGGCEQLRCVM